MPHRAVKITGKCRGQTAACEICTIFPEHTLSGFTIYFLPCGCYGYIRSGRSPSGFVLLTEKEDLYVI